MRPGRVDAVILSHEHPDHWTDLESFAVWLRQSAGRTAGPGLRPAGAPSALLLRRRTRRPRLAGPSSPRPDRRGRRGADLQLLATDHGPPTLAVRFDPADRRGAARGRLGGSLAYTADTGPDWSVAELGRGIGTVLCEATYTREHEGASGT